MDIECKLKREGGTHVEIGTSKYHFAPLADGAHVATVENEAHQERFLSITEAYRLYRGSEKGAGKPIKVQIGGPQDKQSSGDLRFAASGPTHEPIETKTYPDGVTATGPAPLPEQSPEALLGAVGYLDGYEFHGKSYTFAEIVQRAFVASNVSADAWNVLTDDERADLIDEQLDQLAADANGDGTVDQSEERAALAAEYKAKFGKAPASRLSVAKIREALAAQ